MSVQRVSMDDVLKLQQKGKLREAEGILLNILNVYEDNVEAIFSLGTTYAMMGCDGLATILFRFCLEKMPDDGNIWNNLGTAYRKLYRNEKAVEAFTRAWKRDPRDDVASNLSTLYVNEGCPGKGVEWYLRALEINPIHRHANWNGALMLLEMEQWAEGFRQYAWGMTTGDRQRKLYHANPWIPWWNGTSLKDKRIIVNGEQGMGDEIMYASQIPEICEQAGQVLFDCHPRLFSLFQYSFRKYLRDGKLVCYPTRKTITGKEEWVGNYKRIDWKRSLADTPMYLRQSADHFPRVAYLEPKPNKVKEYKNWIELLPGNGRPIGLTWMGGKRQTRKDLRAILLHNLVPVLKAANELDFKLIDCNYLNQEWEVKELLAEEEIPIWRFPEIFELDRWQEFRIRHPQNKEILKTFTEKDQAKSFCKQIGLDSEKVVEHWPGCGHDYMDTAAFITAIAELDGIVISVNQTMVHLCGALGVPCWSMTPKRPAWRYGLRNTRMQWYGDWVYQIRQQNPDTWDDVFERIIGYLFDAPEHGMSIYTESLHGELGND